LMIGDIIWRWRDKNEDCTKEDIRGTSHINFFILLSSMKKGPRRVSGLLPPERCK